MQEDLLARRQQAEDSFNSLVKDKETKQLEMDQLDTEMARLQGEWRLVNDLLDKLSKEKPKKSNISKEADIIDVTDVQGA